MIVTVCGSAGTHPGPGRACSSYLLSDGGLDVLLDCGNGSLANLQQRRDVAELDALLLSHLHPDHFADLYGLYYARRFHPSGMRPLPVHAPPGTREHLGQLLQGDEDFGKVCAFSVVRPGDNFELAAWSVRLFEAAHPAKAMATRVEADGVTVAYTGDSGPAASLVECARDADLLISEASWLERDGPFPEALHMTGRQAGELAAAAGAARLLVTHVRPTTDSEEVAAEAAAAYDGEVLLARDLMELSL